MKYDPAFCEREYNARAAVPDHAMHMRAWVEESHKVRIGSPCYLDIPYGAQPKQTLDFFPPGAAAAPRR